MFEKNSFSSKENINGKIHLNFNVIDGQYCLKFKITKVYDWYDEAYNLYGSGKIENNILYFSINNNELQKGLYTLIMIEEENNVFTIGDGYNENLLGAFCILGKCENPENAYKKIVEQRELNFNKIKVISNNEKADLYSVLIFSKNILVSTIAQHDDVQIFPYDYLKCTSEINYINSFIKDNLSIDLRFKEDKFNSSIPSSVFLITNIKADSYDMAEEYALEKASILNNLYSMLLKSHGHFFATVTMNETKHISKLNVFNTRYKGNLLLFADQGHNVLHFYKTLCKNNSYLITYIKLLNDAINEENRMMKYYRYWNILEGISEHYDLEYNDMKKWNGEIVLNKKNKNVKVGSGALDRVFEYLRINFSNKTEEELIGNAENIKKVKVFLSICYQRRCCCAHSGEKCANTTYFCEKKEEMKRCRKFNIIHLDEPLGFQDKILRRLEELVIDVIRFEMKKECGPLTKQINLINKVIK